MLKITSLDLSVLVREFQVLVGARLNKFYQLKNRFSLRIKSMNLNVVLPGLVFLSETLRYAAPQATPLTMGIRKHVLNGVVRAVSQRGTERILEIEIEKAGHHFFFLIELFSRGNIRYRTTSTLGTASTSFPLLPQRALT